jgi:hypothetical protein
MSKPKNKPATTRRRFSHTPPPNAIAPNIIDKHQSNSTKIFRGNYPNTIITLNSKKSKIPPIDKNTIAKNLFPVSASPYFSMVEFVESGFFRSSLENKRGINARL